MQQLAKVKSVVVFTAMFLVIADLSKDSFQNQVGTVFFWLFSSFK